MSRKCSKTGKKTSSGNNRSHSRRATKRTFRPNIQKTRIYDPITGEYKTIKVAASYIRTLAKRLQQGKKV
ncbi:50S ribosomal protein L28 [Candidatus Peregrinibacteria bacterium]|nr:50S ribosomal protein L28 [Candidatus Peregrinibacteria bacterium]MBT5468105.1 50S ribosomal protein L28 [Candidatus Peregrinibacteria bacterium]MBT7337113.1 50S ribosomal protein L28 [Candidatus Peregrinibacteria bacterium]